VWTGSYNRKKFEPRKSVDEAVEALESVARILTGKKGKSATLGKLIPELKNAVQLPSPLDGIIDKLYGYTSEEARHGQTELSEIDFEEAELVLHICSAWINYIIKCGS